MPSLNEAKSAGNNCVATNKDYKQAIIEYTKGLEDPQNNNNKNLSTTSYEEDGAIRHLILGSSLLLRTQRLQKRSLRCSRCCCHQRQVCQGLVSCWAIFSSTQ